MSRLFDSRLVFIVLLDFSEAANSSNTNTSNLPVCLKLFSAEQYNLIRYILYIKKEIAAFSIKFK